MKIYTKTGDDGTTGLFNGDRVSKNSPRVNLYGTVDELNSIIGLAITSGAKDPLAEDLQKLNNLLFNLGSDLATPFHPAPKFEVPRISVNEIKWLEKKIDTYDEDLSPLKTFILPGGSEPAAFLHQGRTVCRRAERIAVDVSETDELGDHAIIFLNRLSDYLFTAARYANHLSGKVDVEWNKDIGI